MSRVVETMITGGVQCNVLACEMVPTIDSAWLDEVDCLPKKKRHEFGQGWPESKITKKKKRTKTQARKFLGFALAHFPYCQLCNHPVKIGEANERYRMATREHLIPLSKGGSNGWDNLAITCFECNSAKADNEAKIIYGPYNWAEVEE